MSGFIQYIDAVGGVYVHVPFCRRKCPYCDFYSITDLSLVDSYIDCVVQELRQTASADLVFDTLYLGGGTPTVLSGDHIARLVQAAFQYLNFQPGAEVSIEANPGTVGREDLERLRQIGFNRLTIGVQSFDESNLNVLGRIHSGADSEKTLDLAAAAGFDNLGIDLIYGLPDQGCGDWLRDLERALSHVPAHISCYMLTIESGTPLAAEHRCGRFRPAAEEQVAELFLATSGFLEAHGFLHYEISNFARCGSGGCGNAWESRHNVKYWTYAPYRGFGPGAHSFLPPRRFWNHRDVRHYVDGVRSGKGAVEGEEVLTTPQQMAELIMLGLRTASGIDLQDFKRRFGGGSLESCLPAAVELESLGLLTLERDRWAPTRRGMLFHESVVSQLTSQLDEP